MDLSAHKILIVEDVRFTRLTLAKIIREFGQPTVLEAGDGEAALALLRQNGAGIDCIITDLEMPKLDGLALLQAVRAGAGNVPRDTKIVLLTGHSELDRLGPALLLDVDAFLAKPVSRRAMETCLQRLFAPPAGLAAGLAGSPAEPANRSDNAPGRPPCDERMVAVAEIPADAELARDLLFGNGRLLLAAGSRLNARTRDLLAELLPMAGLPPQVWIRAPR